MDALHQKINSLKQEIYQIPSATDISYENLQKVREILFQTRELLPQVPATIQGIKTTYPDLIKTLEKFLSKGDAYRKEQEIQYTLTELQTATDWFEGRLKSKALDYAESLKQTLANTNSTLGFLKQYEKNPSVASVYANQLLQSAAQIEAMALGIQIIYVSESEEKKEKEFSDEEKIWIQESVDALKRVTELRAICAQTLKESAEIEKKRLESARFPKPKMTGGEWLTLEKTIITLLTPKWESQKEKLLRLGIMSDWEIRKEWRKNQDTWIWEHYRFCWVKVALELPDGKARVYSITVRCMKTPEGWGPVMFWGTADSYPILVENVNQE